MKNPRILWVAVAVSALCGIATPARAASLHIDEALWRAAASLVLSQGAAPTVSELALSPQAQALSGEGAAPRRSSPDRSGGTYVNPILRGVGVGLQVGTPTALTLKFAAQGDADIVVGVGAGFGFRDFGRFGLSLHGDYLFQVATLLRNATLSLRAYVGPGLWLTFFDRGYGYLGGFSYYSTIDFVGVGVRVPLGLDMRFSSAPLELYLELDPAVFVFPGVDGFLGASLGFRWFF